MPKILFVEDDEFIAEIYMRKFQEAGFEVKNAKTGKEVMKDIQEDRYDLVMLDLVLPEMSGMEVLKEIRQKPGYPHDIRIVVFSNLSSEEDRAQCVALGANGFISKTGFSPSEVVTEVNRFLRQFAEQDKNLNARNEGGESIGNKDTFAKKKILLIEDEHVFVDMFSRRLKSEGYDVTVRENGAEGLETATNESFDLIISDIILPGMHGHEMVEKLQESEHGRKIPIFLLSASIEESQFKELEASDIVHKVFMKIHLTPSQLAQEVNTFFANQK